MDWPQDYDIFDSAKLNKVFRYDKGPPSTTVVRIEHQVKDSKVRFSSSILLFYLSKKQMGKKATRQKDIDPLETRKMSSMRTNNKIDFIPLGMFFRRIDAFSIGVNAG